MAAHRTQATRVSLVDAFFLIPLAMIATAGGFFLASTLAAWVFASALALLGVGLLAAIGLPAILSIGNRARFFAKSLIVVNSAAILGMLLLFPEGLQEAVRKNGAWPALAIAQYLPSPQKDKVKQEATRIAALVAEKLPDGPGALSYLLPPILEPEEAAPKGTIKPSTKKNAKTTPEAAVVKFKKNGPSIVVNANINDKLSVPLIYDTGASLTTLDSKTASRLGISLAGARYITVETANGTTRQPIVKLSSIEVGGARVEGPIEVAICETCSLSGASGLLGLNFSKAFITEIDPTAGTITFRPRK